MKVWRDKLWKRENKGKKMHCMLYKSETKLWKMWCGLMRCVGQCSKKRHMDEFINVSDAFIND